MSRTKLLSFAIFLIGFSAFLPQAQALPSYARQTGLPCSECHITFPELTEFGREFKLNGYTLTGLKTPTISKPGSGSEAGLRINANLPVSVMFQIADTVLSTKVPGTQNGNVQFPQQFSLFLAGAITPHIGSFVQTTYAADGDHFSMDNTDIRYANKAQWFGRDTVWGLDLNNNPTVEDLWNSTPAWGWPFTSADTTPGPIASSLVDGGLAQDVAGVGAYAMYNHHLYGNFTLYRSMHIGGTQPPDGNGFGINISGAAPYWRAAWQQMWSRGKNYLEFGTYGMNVNSFPNAISGPEDHYLDNAVDAQYERRIGKRDVLTMHTTYIYERQHLDATFAAGGADQSYHNIKTFRADGIYHFGNRISTGLGFFNINGTPDATLYGQAAVNGSANGNPKSDGYFTQLGFWPAQNVELSVAYQGYWKFNGASTNYDGAGRNASDNNNVFLSAWFVF